MLHNSAMELINLLLFLMVFSLVIKANPSDNLKEDSEILNASLPVFTWINQAKIRVEFPGGENDVIVLWKAEKIAEIEIECLWDGTMEGEASSDVVISGCQNDPLVSITIHSNRFIGRTMFNVRNGATEELQNPYANNQDKNELDDYEDEKNQRIKRSLFEDYVEEDYDEYAADGHVDPPPRLNLDMKLGFEESLKTHLGGETAARNYVIEVFTHAKSYMKHHSLGTQLNLNVVGAPIYVANKNWKARRQSMAEAKAAKSNESVPIVFFCYDGDDETYLGISKIRGACDPIGGVGIVKHREAVQLAANTLNHENGHLVGLQHDQAEDNKNKEAVDDPCHGNGFMSEISPADRPNQFSYCSARRFKLWYNNYGTDCLTEVKIPMNLKTCPYPRPSAIFPCVCKADSQYNAYLFCSTMDQNLANTLATSFMCSKKIHTMEINMMGDQLNCSFGRENIGRLQIENFKIYNISKVNADIDANAFAGSSNTLKEIKIQKLPEMESGKRTIKTEAFSSLNTLEKIEIGEDFETLQTQSFSGLPSIKKLSFKGVKTIETKAFHEMAALRRLDFTESPLETINTEAFFNLPSLTAIVFNTGTITTLHTKSFSGLASLSKIDISGNKIQTLPSNSFYNLTSLSSANLTNNQITSISSNMFNMVPNLKSIALANNQISSVPSNAFKNLPVLTKIDLSNNKIASINNNAMISLPKLVYLDLTKNEIEEMGKFLENINNKDLVVNLRETKITLLNEESFGNFVNNIVSLGGNGHIDVSNLVLECQCDINWMFSQQDISRITKFHNAMCEEGHELNKVDAKLLEQFCPSLNCVAPLPANGPECESYQSLTDSWRRIDYTNRGKKASHCDNTANNFVKKWYRFEGDAGSKLPTRNAPTGIPTTSTMICGTHRTSYMTSEHPEPKDGIVNRKVCFEWSKQLCPFHSTIQVRACYSNDRSIYYVYELVPQEKSCSNAYCALP